MYTFVSMLRGINVSGHNKIGMPDLKYLYETLNFRHVLTYVQSGNVVFDTSEKDISGVSSLIESNILKSFGFFVPVVIRDKNDFNKIISHNPFLIDRNEDPAKLHVTFLLNPPSASDLAKLPSSPNESDEFILKGKEIFIFCPDGYGRTKLNNNFFEKKLNTVATTRNWNTVNALYKMAGSR
jgi:uncharacterized protein (DUF1697 family)